MDNCRGKSNLISNLFFPGSTGTKVLITTGEPTSSSTKTEVVDVKSGETCSDLDDFPLQIRGGVAANLDGTPVVCGGLLGSSTYYQTCYKLTISGWQEFASMNEKRYQAAGVMYQNEFHVFGGYNGSSYLQTSELISIHGGVEFGPDLPTTVLLNHAITSINSTASILSGGITSATTYSPLTWYFNHETSIFSPGPSLLEGRNGHGSATCVDMVTKEKIPIISGGYGNGYVKLDSTELLINEEWQQGTIHGKQHVLGGFQLEFVNINQVIIMNLSPLIALVDF